MDQRNGNIQVVDLVPSGGTPERLFATISEAPGCGMQLHRDILGIAVPCSSCRAAAADDDVGC